MKKLLTCLLLVILTGNQIFSQSKVKTFYVEHRFINIPIEANEELQQVVFKIDNKELTSNSIRVSRNNVDYWAFIDVSKYKGKKFTMEFSEYVHGIEKIFQSDTFVGEDTLYKEKLRPQLHFTTRRGWTNDPNGLVYYKG